MALGLYAAGLLAMLGCSALYNLAATGPRKTLLCRLDHAVIFVMIAGTYTPTPCSRSAAPGGGGCWVPFGRERPAGRRSSSAPGRLARISVAAYLLLGWTGLAALDPLLAALPPRDLALLAGGGLLYSLGVAVHLSTGLPYHNALWHALVLAAAACH